MTITRRLGPSPARVYLRTTQRGKRALRLVGAITCLLAIFVSAGGHWAVLQSFVYTRMLVEFAEKDSWCTALKKTFDDRYACSLCPKIRDGYNKERKVPRTVSGERLPEFLVQSRTVIFFAPLMVANVSLVSARQVYFANAPPKPPPRVA